MPIQAPQLDWIIAETSIIRTPPKALTVGNKTTPAIQVPMGKIKMSLGYKPRDVNGNPTLTPEGIEEWVEIKCIFLQYALEDVIAFAIDLETPGSAYTLPEMVRDNYPNAIQYLDGFLSEPLYKFIEFMVNRGKWKLQ